MQWLGGTVLKRTYIRILSGAMEFANCSEIQLEGQSNELVNETLYISHLSYIFSYIKGANYNSKICK